MIDWIKGLFSKTYRRIRIIVKAVKAFISDHWEIIEYAIVVVKEIEALHRDKPGPEKAKEALKRILAQAERNDWVVTTRWVNFAIELAVLLLKDTKGDQ